MKSNSGRLGELDRAEAFGIMKPDLADALFDEYAAGAEVRSGGEHFEKISWPIFSTMFYHSRETESLSFFSETHHTNLYFPHQLPAPQFFLLQGISLYGIGSDLAYGNVRLELGNKVYLEVPAWTMSVSLRRAPKPVPILFPQRTYFKLDIFWETAVDLGKGLSGKPERARPIQCVFWGLLGRPVQ